MTSVAFRLLKKVAKRGELSLKDAIEFPKARLDHDCPVSARAFDRGRLSGFDARSSASTWSRRVPGVFSSGFPSHVHPSERQQRRSALSGRCFAPRCAVVRQCGPRPAARFFEGEGGALPGPVRTKTLGSFLGVSFRVGRGRGGGTGFGGLEEETRPVACDTRTHRCCWGRARLSRLSARGWDIPIRRSR